MASITSTGIGSGLDVSGLVQQLVAAEGQATEIRIAQQEARAQAKLSAYGSLKSALSTFGDELEKMSDLDTLLARSGSTGDESLLTVSVDETAVPASYNVEVVQLAQAQKLESGAFAGADTVVGTGTLTIAVGTESFSLSIDSENNTLEGIRDAINTAVDNKGVAATIVNGDSGSYLILAGENTGSDQSIVVTQSGGDGGLSALEYDPANMLESLTERQAAQDAQVRIDGVDVTSDNNVVVGAIEGVTLTLVTANPGTTTEVSIKNDVDAVRNQIRSFVDGYNALIDAFDAQTGFDPETEIAGPLLGDLTVRGVRDQLRRELTTEVTDIDASFSSLLDIGIETDVNGKLTVNDSKLDEALGSEFSKLGQLFANSDGYAVRLSSVIDGYLDDEEGILTARTDGLDRTIEGFAEQREVLRVRLESLEARLLRQFNALDALVSELTTTSSFLTQQLGNLPGISTPDN